MSDKNKSSRVEHTSPEKGHAKKDDAETHHEKPAHHEIAHRDSTHQAHATKHTKATADEDEDDAAATATPPTPPAQPGGGAATGDADADLHIELTPAQAATAAEALERITPRAMALKPDEVIPFRVVPALAIVNVRTAKANLAGHRADIVSHLPKLDITRFDSLEDTALSVVASAANADKSDGSASEMLPNLAKARSLRGKLLPVLGGLAASGLVPMTVYQDILRGRGSRDTAQDCVDLPAAFRQYAAAIQGKHSASAADLAEAETVGTWLLRNLTVSNAPGEKKAVVSSAVDLRNRVATLLIQDYGDAEVIGHYFFRADYASYVPPLGSRRVERRDEAVPTPAPPVAPALPVAAAPAAAPAQPALVLATSAPATPPLEPAPPPTTGKRGRRRGKRR